MEQKYLTTNFRQTQKIGRVFGQQILEDNEQLLFKIMSLSKKAGVVIALEGDLGSGKTIFVQGLAKGLGVKEKMLSPTFFLMKKFQIRKTNDTNFYSHRYTSLVKRSGRAKFQTFFHIDSYRIKNSKEILNLGFKKIVSDPQNIVAIEWANRIKKIIPKRAIWIKIKLIDKNTRKIIIKL